MHQQEVERRRSAYSFPRSQIRVLNIKLEGTRKSRKLRYTAPCAVIDIRRAGNLEDREWIDESQSFLSDECPSYMLIYDVLQDICEEQQEIMSESMDKHTLLHVFSKLVRLQTLTVCFCPTVEEEEWVGAVLARGLTMEDSCEYHSRVIHDAIEASRRGLSNEPDLQVLLTVQPP
ncbi:Uncharacterized protein PECH_001153 [Penicillium ucsense]|uniref:Uncharacterized protein n=1 Tax=Penicillium ucsense TaxID=2839758 RepID=A0A8J8WAZ6_9EURO|nr:Uncharacterized protein PECM_000052 [Penicillium ucsense]KAF7733103.1 Uncharacterized protein PECH_001153 [Penicillium ucsense]